MKKVMLFCLIGLIVTAFALSACSSQSSTSTTTEASTNALVFPNQGNIRISGDGYFRFQRFDQIEKDTAFEGVVFNPHQEQPGVTSTGPIMYKIDVEFEDGTVEVLQYIGLGNENNIDINLTQHEHPKAGIMLAWHNVDGGLTRALYLLVGEQ